MSDEASFFRHRPGATALGSVKTGVARSMMMSVRGVWLGLFRWCCVVCHFYDCPHPRMNAALETSDADRHLWTSSRWTVFSCSRWNENYRSKIQAFRSGDRIAGNAVEFGDESATEISHRRKGMYLTAAVFDECRPSDIQVRLGWLVAPFVRVLSCFQFFDELSKCRVPVSDACAIAEYCVESGRFTII